MKASELDDPRGLTYVEAARRLAVDGPNQLRSAPPVPQWRRVLRQFRDPLVYLLLGAMAVSLVAWWVEGRRGAPVDVLVIAVVVLANAGLGFVQQAKAQSAVLALKAMTAVTSAVMREGTVQRIPSDELVRGDLLVLGEGDSVGADARLTASALLRVQESSLTGESEATDKHVGPTDDATPLAERTGEVFKGTAVVQGTAQAEVTATGMDTEMGTIAALLESTEDRPTPLQREISRIGTMLGAAVLIIAVVVVVTVLLTSDVESIEDVVTVLLLGVSLAVAAVPEGLPAILSVVLALGVRRMAGRRAIIKDLASVETLGSASVIATDKTGTLTKSEMTIERVVTASGHATITGVGYAPVGSVHARIDDGGGDPEVHQVASDRCSASEDRLLAEGEVVLSGGSLTNNADLRHVEGQWEIQGDPTEAAFLVAERKLGLTEDRVDRFDRVAEIPFTSDRKIMSTVQVDHARDGGRVLVTKGAPDVLLRLCDQVRIGRDVETLDDARRLEVLAAVAALSDRALRTLSVAYRPLTADEKADGGEALEHHLIFAGTVGIIDPPRPEVAVAVAEAHRAGIRVVMITGDHPRTALRIAEDLGIVAAGEQALTGADLDKLDERALVDAVRETSVFARVAPRHKLLIIDALQADGNVVAMTGDGVNDAPALKSADLGIAMGLTGTEVTKEAATMILADDNFATIVDAVREGRGIFDDIQKFLRYLLGSNIGEVLTVFLGVVLAGMLGLSGQGEALVLPLLATQILWINLVTDSGPALAMGVDPETEDVMARRPRRMDERIIDARMWMGVGLVGLVTAAVTLLTIDLYLPRGLIDLRGVIGGDQDLTTARTAGFTVLVLAQLFNCLNARSETVSVFRHLFVNRWLGGALALSLALQVAVVHLGFLNVAFSTAPLRLDQWAVCVLMASMVLWAVELRKVCLRLVDRHPRRAARGSVVSQTRM